MHVPHFNLNTATLNSTASTLCKLCKHCTWWLHTGGALACCKRFTEVAVSAQRGSVIKEVGAQFKAVSIQCIRGRPFKGRHVRSGLDEKHSDESALYGTFKKNWIFVGEKSKHLEGEQRQKNAPKVFKEPIVVSLVYSE